VFDIIGSEFACYKKEFAQPAVQGQDKPRRRSSRNCNSIEKALLEKEPYLK
jgi:hypothetical protein